MIVWLFATIALLVWNAGYCAWKIVVDFRGPRPANGFWGLVALAGVLSTLALVIVGLLTAMTGTL